MQLWEVPEVHVKKMMMLSVLLGLALIIFTVEAQIPPLAPIPGVKLGLANVITLIAIYLFGRKEAFSILILRIILSSIFAGNFTGFLYSLSGGLTCFLVMGVASRFLNEDRMWIVSELGAIGHNIGQIFIAFFITGTPYILWYFPILLISAVITGFFTGMTAQIPLKKLRRMKVYRLYFKEERHAKKKFSHLQRSVMSADKRV